jgi:nitrogen fixation protein FixH
MSATPRRQRAPRRALWIPWTIAGVFAAIVAADLFMVTLATRSDPGLVAGAQARLATGYVLPPATGLQLDMRQGRGEGGSMLVEARLRDRDGRPAHAASMTAVVQRATDARADAELALAPAAAPDPDGAVPWRAAVPPLAGGAWDVAVQARDAGGAVLATATMRLKR